MIVKYLNQLVEDEFVIYYRMDVIWYYLFNLKVVDGSYRFGCILKVVKFGFIIFYFNVEDRVCRIFDGLEK